MHGIYIPFIAGVGVIGGELAKADYDGYDEDEDGDGGVGEIGDELSDSHAATSNLLWGDV